VVGIDINAKSVADLNNGVAPVNEPGLQELIDEAGSRLRATTEVPVALRDSEVSYLIVPTPSNNEGVFTNKYVIQALWDIGEELRTRDRRHTVVVCSTVMPGSCHGELTTALEKSSGKIVGEGIGLVYSPEFIALGSVVKNMHFPDVILIGESDAESGAIVERNALSVARNTPSVQHMNMVNAEIVKLSINTFVTTKISFANMLSEICDGMPGADVDVVTEAVGSDSRIGTKYLKGALGYGGPCFPRDNIALTRLADSLGVDATIAQATDAVNDRQTKRILDLVAKMTEPGATVAILGLSYKPDTSVCEMSQGVEIANRLLAAGFIVVAHDPQADHSTAPNLDSRVQFISDLDAAVTHASTVVLSTAWPEFQSLTREQLHGKFVVDAWGILGNERPTARLGKLQASVKYKVRENENV